MQPGDEIVYEIRLRNEGDQDLIIPAGALEDPLNRMTYKADSAEPAVLALGGNTLRNTEPLTVSAGGNLTLRLTAILDADLQEGDAVPNTVCVREPGEFSAESRWSSAPSRGATLSGWCTSTAPASATAELARARRQQPRQGADPRDADRRARAPSRADLGDGRAHGAVQPRDTLLHQAGRRLE